MKVYALYGESGSGKSYRAMWIARKYGLKYVIDDGLLISGGSVIAGKSAKKEKTKMGSTKRAIFHDDADAAAMNKTLKKHKVDSLLILGTSKRMVSRIAQRIGAGEIEKYIDIHDIASEEEIATAKRIRSTQGMHVIPVPTMAIKKDFQGYFMDTLEILLTKAKYKSEKTVMRPSYSYMGDYSVDRNVLVEICRYVADKTTGVKAEEARINSRTTGVTVYIGITVKNPGNLREKCTEVRNAIIEAMEEYVGITAVKVDICVRDIEF